MIDTVIFDLDGTLIDTLHDLTDSINHVMRLHGFPERSVPEIRSFVGNGIPTLVRRSLPSGTPESTAVICTNEMNDYYKTHAKIKTMPYEKISELLEELNKMKIKTAVVTNKSEPAAKILCNEFFFDKLTAVIGDNGKDALKPAPDNVFRALKLLGSDKNSAIYVGDSDVDILTAQNANVKSVGVLWGFRDEATLKSCGADYIISAPTELITVIDSVNNL